MENSQVAELFEDIAGLLEIKGEKVFTIRAYQRAARTIERLPTDLDHMVRNEIDLQTIPGIGKAISEKISEYVGTGKLEYFEKLKAEFPDGILDLMQVPGLGPKTVKRLWDEIEVTNVDLLEAALEDGRVASLPRMGKKTADNLIKQLKFHRTKSQRMPIARAMPIAKRVMAHIKEQCPNVDKFVVAGSLRRFEETIGDIDIVCTSSEPQKALDALVDMPGVLDVLVHGDTKASVYLNDGIQVDLRVVDDARFGSMIQYFTGSQQHAIRLRDYANKIGLSLNEYGITDVEAGTTESFGDEASFYERLGMQVPPPEVRVGIWEVESALESKIPKLVYVSDIRGDLHDHTDWSDGRDTMEQMIRAAKENGLEYIAITDHSVGRAIANGLSVDRLRDHMKQLREVEAKVGGIRVLCGTEMDIRADGSLDYEDDILSELDWVIGSIHSAMGQDSATMTERVIKAMHNPHVDVIGHLSTRLIGERQPVEADYEEIFKAAANTGTALEINGSPERLDLKDAHLHRARELGVPLVINTDSHTVESLGNLEYGTGIARRGWCEPRHILNTWPLEDFLNFIRLDKPQRTKEFASHV